MGDGDIGWGEAVTRFGPRRGMEGDGGQWAMGEGVE